MSCCKYQSRREHPTKFILVVNWDQTAAKFVPTSEWTMAEEGSRQVEIFGLEDKREMTVLLTCTLSGTLLPPQLIYGGKTPQCHAKVEFPQGWDVWHAPNHWSTEDTMLRYVDTVLLPYIQATRSNLSLPPDYPGLAIFDIFAAHRCESLLEKLRANNIRVVYIPAGCTGELQPLDLTVNEAYKAELKMHL